LPVDSRPAISVTFPTGMPPSLPQTKLTPKRRSSPLFEEKDRIKEALESVPDFSQLFERKTPADVQALLDEFLLGESDAEAVSSETVKYNNTTSEVDKAFQELL